MYIYQFIIAYSCMPTDLALTRTDSLTDFKKLKVTG